MNNERIQQLADRAGIEWDDKYHYFVSAASLRLFAQSVAHECLLFTNPSPHEGTEFGDALAWVDKNIKEHFGL